MGAKKLYPGEIEKDEFLAAAQKFADTAIQHGRDVYGPEKSPMFVQYLHRDKLKSPAIMGWLRPDQGGPKHPVVLTRFEKTQNLMRLLASLSQFTGDAKYVEAAMDASISMYENYSYPISGLLASGNHMSIDLISGKAYSDGRGSEQFELANEYPFYEFLHDISPEKGSKLVKAIWETYIRDWHTMRYNRHAQFNTKVDYANVWNRELKEVKDLPQFSEGELGFIEVSHDLVYAAFTLGCVENDVKPRQWANRLLEVTGSMRDPKTKIWPTMIYPPPFLRRGLDCYAKAYPDSNVTEARVIVSSWLNSQASFGLGALGSIEHARKFGHDKEMTAVHDKIDEWLLGFMNASYDRKAHNLKSIQLDGTDVTDFVFKEGACLHGWGAAPGGFFARVKVHPSYFATFGLAYRLETTPEKKDQYWSLLRDLFKGEGLGDIGENSRATPVFNYQVKFAEQGYVFGLTDIYRVTRNPEILKFMEHLGREIIKRRQDPKSGLFVIEADRPIGFRTLKEFKDPNEDKTIADSLKELGYDRPKVVPLEVNEPHALLAIHGCRTGRFDRIPSWISVGMAGGRIFSRNGNPL